MTARHRLHLQRLPHLVRRFFTVIAAKRPGPAAQGVLAELLSEDEARLFYLQQPADQAHAVRVADRVGSTRPGDRIAVRAALLHDVGKAHSRLGAFGRTVATVLAMTGRHPSGDMAAYLDHGRLGAEDLAVIGCDAFVVEFARRHPGPAPEGADTERWAALLVADDE